MVNGFPTQKRSSNGIYCIKLEDDKRATTNVQNGLVLVFLFFFILFFFFLSLFELKQQ